MYIYIYIICCDNNSFVATHAFTQIMCGSKNFQKSTQQAKYVNISNLRHKKYSNFAEARYAIIRTMCPPCCS